MIPNLFHARCAHLRRHLSNPWIVISLFSLLLGIALAMASCVSASYERRTWYPPPIPPAAKPQPEAKPLKAMPQPASLKQVSFQDGPGYTPSNGRGALKSEVVVRGQDSTSLWSGTGGVGGILNNVMSFAGSEQGTGLLQGILGTTVPGAGLLALVNWWKNRRHAQTVDNHAKTLNSQWDEAYHAGYLAGVAAGARGGLPAAPPPA